MVSSLPAKLSQTMLGTGLVLLMAVCSVLADTPLTEVSKLLPPRVGRFNQVTSVRPLKSLAEEGILNPEILKPGSFGGEAEYVSPADGRFLVEFVQLTGYSQAYSLFTIVGKSMRDANPGENLSLGTEVGTSSIISSRQIAFFKGLAFVRISATSVKKAQAAKLTELAQLIAGQIDKGEGDVPPLVKHLPDWQNGQRNPVYLSSFKSLESLAPHQEVLKAVSTEGDADAVLANYGGSQLLIIEFNTPQLASENDQRIIARIHDLWNQGQPAPTAYSRVGNYSVFVFDAPDEQTARQLIAQVRYEQVVQWLGENPNLLKEAEKRYVETTLGVLVAVMKASGLALVGCLSLGGLFGALLFSRRRKQQLAIEAFSDAGGLLRLNIDELTPQTHPARLIRERN